MNTAERAGVILVQIYLMREYGTKWYKNNDERLPFMNVKFSS
jgi:hypothetical protein